MAAKEVGEIDFKKLFEELEEQVLEKPPEDSFSVKDYGKIMGLSRNTSRNRMKKLLEQGKIKALETKYILKNADRPTTFYVIVNEDK